MVLGVALRVSGKGHRVHRFGTQGYGLGLMVEGFGFRVQDLVDRFTNQKSVL